ncbi:MAG: WD40 repeat domain-containing protein [Planctomycetes bacterium]|nr:WD40 repeat domain-containing protein [Planctomycetota bacterium]
MRCLFPLLLATAVLGTHNAVAAEPEHLAQRAPAANRVDVAGDPLPEQVLLRFGTLRRRSSGSFRKAAISPDGKFVAAMAASGEAQLWDVATGKRIRELGEIRSNVEAITFSLDGKDIVMAPRFPHPNRIVRWSADGRRADVFASELVNGDVHALAYSPDGKLLASGTARNVLLLWDAKTREVIRQLEGHTEPIYAVVFSPDGNLLASGGGHGNRDTNIRLWNVGTGKLVGTLVGHKDPIRCLTLSRDGKLLASGSSMVFGDKAAFLWEVASKKLLRRLPVTSLVGTLAISPDDKILAAGGVGDIQLWELTTGKPLRRLQGFGAYVRQVAFTPDGKWLVAACEDAIRTWDTATWEQASLGPGHTTVIHQLAFTPDGRTLISLAGDGSLYTWDPRSSKERHRLAPSRGGGSGDPRMERRGPLALAPDGKTAATFAYANKNPLQIWDVASGKLLFDLPDPTTVVGALSFSADVKALFVTGNRGVRVWSVKDRKPISLLGFRPEAERVTDYSDCILALPEGRTAVGCGLKALSFLDVTSGRLLGSIDLPYKFGCKSVALSPDGRLLATVPRPVNVSTTPVHVWDVATGRLLRVIDGEEIEGRPQVPAIGHGSAVAQAAFSPDGLTLASAGLHDGTVRLWDVLTGKQLVRLEGHDGGVTSVAFAPDGRTLASGGFDTTILLWDVRKFVKPAAAKDLGDKELDRLWEALGAGDPDKSLPSVVALAGAGDRAVGFLKKHLKPIAKIDEGQVRRLIRDLDARAFATRQKATGELARLGELAEPALRNALQDKPSNEAKTRLESLLADVRPWVREPEALRQLRSVHVLERVGTAEALRLLESLAAGAEDARLTREARAARDRLRLHQRR